MKKTRSDYIYVGVQFLFFAVYLLPCSVLDFVTTNGVPILGGLLLFLGILVGILAIVQLHKQLSPFPTPISNATLIQTGVFRYSRHPIYTAILCSFTGYGLYAGSGYKLLITIALFVLFFFKSRYEELRLSTMFDSYSDYKKRTGRFFPTFKKNV